MQTTAGSLALVDSDRAGRLHGGARSCALRARSFSAKRISPSGPTSAALRLSTAGARAALSRAIPICSNSIPAVQARARPRPRLLSLRGGHRHGDRWFDCLPLRQQSLRRLQAKRRPRLAGWNHPDRPQSGYGRADHAHRNRRSDSARRNPDPDRRCAARLHAASSGAGLEGRRIGVDRRYFTPAYGGENDLIAVLRPAIHVMRDLGPRSSIPIRRFESYFDAEFTRAALRVQGADRGVPRLA